MGWGIVSFFHQWPHLNCMVLSRPWHQPHPIIWIGHFLHLRATIFGFSFPSFPQSADVHNGGLLNMEKLNWLHPGMRVYGGVLLLLFFIYKSTLSKKKSATVVLASNHKFIWPKGAVCTWISHWSWQGVKETNHDCKYGSNSTLKGQYLRNTPWLHLRMWASPKKKKSLAVVQNRSM